VEGNTVPTGGDVAQKGDVVDLKMFYPAELYWKAREVVAVIVVAGIAGIGWVINLVDSQKKTG